MTFSRDFTVRGTGKPWANRHFHANRFTGKGYSGLPRERFDRSDTLRFVEELFGWTTGMGVNPHCRDFMRDITEDCPENYHTTQWIPFTHNTHRYGHQHGGSCCAPSKWAQLVCGCSRAWGDDHVVFFWMSSLTFPVLVLRVPRLLLLICPTPPLPVPVVISLPITELARIVVLVSRKRARVQC